jgi:DNA-binding Lrp family transcriptional regulator
MTETTFTIQKAKKPRHQLRLPQPYFIVVDDWLEKLGERSYLLWFKLLAKVDRTDETKDTVKYTQQKLAKSLGISKPTLINQLKSLYEYGFIEYKEYVFENGNVGENIVVFEAPMNDDENLLRPLKKVREWENRTNEKFSFTKKGGRPKKEVEEQPEEQPQEPKKPEPKKETPVLDMNEVNPVTYTEYVHFEKHLIANNVDLDVLQSWLKKTNDSVYYVQQCFVIKQLATFPEPIQKTSAFISTTLEKASSFHTPVTEKMHEPEKPERNTPRVPFYNWLEN